MIIIVHLTLYYHQFMFINFNLFTHYLNNHFKSHISENQICPLFII
jgi:hypothetical protein